MPGCGKTTYFASQIGKAFYVTRFPPLGELVADAVRWAVDDVLPIDVDAPPTLHTSLRRMEDGCLAIHCVNLTGGERFFSQIVPLHNCRFSVRMPESGNEVTTTQVSTKKRLRVVQEGEWWICVVPKLESYDVIVFEEKEG